MLTAIVTRLRALGETGRGGAIKPANLAASNGAVATTITATRQVSELVMDAVDHCPCARATVAVVRPQNGHGTPVIARSGHGMP